jgi:DNA repair protein RecN (Recombination protein N)
MDPAQHLAILDAASGCGEGRRQFVDRYEVVASLIARLDALEEGAAERERRIEIARHDHGELERARLDDPDEERALEAERLRQRSLARLAEAADDAIGRLHSGDGAALATVERIARRLPELAAIDPALGEIAALLEQAAAPLGEATRALLDYQAGLAADPDRLDAIEERLALLARLKRKHGVAEVADLLARRDVLARECRQAEHDVADPEALRRELADAADRAWEAARALSSSRRSGAERLAQAMDRELAELGMAGARFSVALEAEPPGSTAGPAAALVRDGVGLGPAGCERAELLLAANPGEGARPLARVASGGELSRIALALRTIGDLRASAASAGEQVGPTMIFDEVDAGIGGRTAEIVGRRLGALAREQQIICITHLAPIAAFADHHYAVQKEAVAGGRTRTRAVAIEADARVDELARMIGGTRMSAECRRHAQEMLRAASQPASPTGRGRDRAPADERVAAQRTGARTPGRRLRAVD